MGIELVTFRTGKDEKFEQDVLHYASTKYGSKTTQKWKVMATPVDSADWIDLYLTVARHSAMEATAEEWPECDAWSLNWDVLTQNGWIHPPQPLREQLVTRLELDSFDQRIAKRAPKYDMVTFLQPELLNCNANLRKLPTYTAYVLTHECVHACADWTNRPELVVDGVPPEKDPEVVRTLHKFIHHCGGWDAFKERYLI